MQVKSKIQFNKILYARTVSEVQIRKPYDKTDANMTP